MEVEIPVSCGVSTGEDSAAVLVASSAPAHITIKYLAAVFVVIPIGALYLFEKFGQFCDVSRRWRCSEIHPERHPERARVARDAHD